MSVEGKSPGTEPAGSPSRRRTVWWVVAAVAAVVVIGVGIAFAAAPKDATAESTPTGASSANPSASASPAPSASGTSSPSATTPAEADPFPEQAPVAPQETGSADGISAALVKFENVTGEVTGSGDVAAAAVRVTVDITNTGSNPLDLNLVVMNAYMGAERDPAETYEQPGGQPVSGSLQPGDTATGVYLFRIPEDRRDDVTFVLDYQAGQPAITFRGQVP